MDINSASSRKENKSEIGYLIVRVSTALGAIPLKDAAVHIRSNTEQSSGVVYSLLSDGDGLTKKVSLPTPPRTLSEHPSDSIPYSSWSIDVFKEGYVPISFTDVPVYSSVVSVQPAVLVPISENFYTQQSYSESVQPDL